MYWHSQRGRRGLGPLQMRKISNSSSPDLFLQAQNASKSIFGQPQTMLGELTTLSRPPSRLGMVFPSPFPSSPRLWRLELGAYGVSVLRPLNTNSWLRQ